MASVKLETADSHPTLTVGQAHIAHASHVAKQLVIAGAGTGKTFTLIHRVSFLVNEESLSPGSEILLLTFSRAAAREIKDRLKLTEGRSRYVHVSTFDSFATRLLATVDPAGDWPNRDYDGRIEVATTAISSGGADSLEFLKPYRHILVDELQDLVGVRADMVKSILNVADSGWTLFGDPAQAIYSFQVPEKERPTAAGSFRQWLHDRFQNSFKESTLQDNYRAKTENTRLALPVGTLLNAPTPDFNLTYKQLREILACIPSVQGFPDNSPLISALRRGNSASAFLCRNNGQALIFSERLRRLGLPHRLQGPATDRALAPWIAIVLSRLQSSSVSKRAFLSACEEVGKSDSEKAWTLLKRTEGDKSPHQLNLKALTGRIRTGCVLDELIVPQEDRIVVSTIHRAKGLEFDRVVIAEPTTDDAIDDEGGFPDEVRLLYVALTRAKSEMLHMNPLKLFFLRRTATARWYRSGDEPWKRLGIEMRPDDVEHLYPAAAGTSGVADAQHYISNSVGIGDSVELHKKVLFVEGQPRVHYSISHKGREVGCTNQRFTSELLVMYGYKPKNWPEVINNVVVQGIDSIAGADGVAQKCGIGWCDVWLKVRICGLSKFSYDKS